MSRSQSEFPPDILFEQGICHLDTETPVSIKTKMFFPDNGDTLQPAMRNYCAHCPVWEICANWSIEHMELGVWGGLTEEDRKIIRRHRKQGVEPWPALLEHGTRKTSFKAHLMMGELPCQACYDAWISNYPRIVINLKPKPSGRNPKPVENEWS